MNPLPVLGSGEVHSRIGSREDHFRAGSHSRADSHETHSRANSHDTHSRANSHSRTNSHSRRNSHDTTPKKKRKNWWSRFLQLFKKKKRIQNPLSVSEEFSQPFDSSYTTKEGLRLMKRPSIPLSYSTISLPTAQRGSASKRTSLDGIHSDITSYPSGENSSGMTWRVCWI